MYVTFSRCPKENRQVRLFAHLTLLPYLGAIINHSRGPWRIDICWIWAPFANLWSTSTYWMSITRIICGRGGLLARFFSRAWCASLLLLRKGYESSWCRFLFLFISSQFLSHRVDLQRCTSYEADGKVRACFFRFFCGKFAIILWARSPQLSCCPMQFPRWWILHFFPRAGADCPSTIAVLVNECHWL